MRYAEAANRAGYPMLAYALLNNGVRNTFRFPDSTYDGDTDQSGWGPNNYYPEPFYLDGRGNGAYRSPWRNNGGIRGRANLKPKEFVDENGLIPTTLQDSIRIMEKHLIDEAALECAFEGHRWNDLLRIACRMEKEGRSGGTFLHESLSKKYSLSGISMPDYSTSDNWYLPFVTTN
ncbi:MAG: RagB/SusD family nutrient uptake outer membrane protein [Bacteroides sp.]|nr:RagB/SusD family nutrient uptake outer membrane protein [Bacteroides sp.]